VAIADTLFVVFSHLSCRQHQDLAVGGELGQTCAAAMM
jgi:hypothetical protein